MWPNEPNGFRVLLDCGFDDLTCGGKVWNQYGTARQAQVADAPASPAAVMTHVLPAAPGGGGDNAFFPTGDGFEPLPELYVGFWWKMNPDFQGNANFSNKLFFMRAFGATFGQAYTNGVFLVSGVPDQLPWQIGFGHNTNDLDNSHACGGGGLYCGPNAGEAPIHRDTWYRVEAYVKASTCNTCQDATVRWWINGTLVGDYNNLNYGSGIVNELMIGHTWNPYICAGPGVQPAANVRDCSRQWVHHFDHLRVSGP